MGCSVCVCVCPAVCYVCVCVCASVFVTVLVSPVYMCFYKCFTTGVIVCNICLNCKHFAFCTFFRQETGAGQNLFPWTNQVSFTTQILVFF